MVAGIIRVMPSYGLEGSDADQVFWICNEVLERCWGDISEDEETQKRFRNLIYFLHWRRVGSVWPIVHTGEFELQDKVANDILNESINYVLSLKDIAERNKELGELLEREAKGSREDIGYGIIGENKLGYPSDKNGLWRRALEYRLSKMGAKSKFETIVKEVDRENWFCYLNYPETVEEADLVLGELVKTGAKSKFKGYPRFMTLMSLIQTPNTIGVGEHILKFVAENLEKMAKAIIKECPEMEFDSETLATTVFRGAAKGVTEKNELEPLAEIRKVAKKLGSKEADLKLTEKYAKWHQKAIAFQRKTVTPVIEG